MPFVYKFEKKLFSTIWYNFILLIRKKFFCLNFRICQNIVFWIRWVPHPWNFENFLLAAPLTLCTLLNYYYNHRLKNTDRILKSCKPNSTQVIPLDEYYFFRKSKVKVFSKTYFTHKVSKGKVFYFFNLKK